MNNRIYKAEFLGNVTILIAADKKQAIAMARCNVREVFGAENALAHSIRVSEATQDDIDWIKDTGGFLPEGME